MLTDHANATYPNELIPRILRDVDDGVLALDRHGRIIYMNPQYRRLLGVKESVLGSTYAEVFFTDGTDKENDRFHQFILDAVYQKDGKHQGTVPYRDPEGKKRYLRITSSFLRNAEENDKSGIIMVISDVTEAETLKKKKQDAAIVFACITACVCLYLLLLATIEFLKINIPTKALTQVINAMVFAISVIIYRKTDFTVDELGLKIRNGKSTFGMAFAVSGAIVALLAGAKYVLLRVAPGFFGENAPFWNWNIGLYSWISYLFTCVIQEFLARSMIYGSIRKMFDGKHAVIGSILLSSLLFGAVHIAHGFVYMTAAILLLGALGGLYEKQRNIWGVAIIHYVLGQAAHCHGFLS
jgi:PAS domain S-box-containing protein